MRLYLYDYHLEFAHLALDDKPKALSHYQQAEQLIKDTGYNRRLPDLEALKNLGGF